MHLVQVKYSVTYQIWFAYKSSSRLASEIFNGLAFGLSEVVMNMEPWWVKMLVMLLFLAKRHVHGDIDQLNAS